MLEIIFFKKKFHIWGFESFIFWSSFLFRGTSLGRFSQCFFLFFVFAFFCSQLTIVADIFTQPPPPPTTTFIKKLFTTLLLILKWYDRALFCEWVSNIEAYLVFLYPRRDLLKLATCTRVSFLIKLQASGLKFKKRLWQTCFPVNFLRTVFLQNTSGPLLLNWSVFR